jgi:hypothetical protein
MSKDDQEPQLIMPVTAPPKIVQRQVDDIKRGAAISQGGQATNMPVLEAFQAFLEQERRKGRAKLAMLTWTYLLLLVLICLGGYLGVSSLMNTMQDDLTDVQGTSISALNTVSNIAASSEIMENQLLSLKKELRNSQQEKQELIASLDSLKTAHESKVNELNDVLSTLEVENASLRQAVSSLETSVGQLGLGPEIRNSPAVMEAQQDTPASTTEPLVMVPRLPELDTLDPASTPVSRVSKPVRDAQSVELPVAVNTDQGESEVNLRIPEIILE